MVAGLLRSEQSLARVGGEEFAILCPETTLGGAHALAERLREAVSGLRVRRGSADVIATCSFGVAELNETLSRFEELYEAADRALYASKTQGRNQVTVAGADAPGVGSISDRAV